MSLPVGLSTVTVACGPYTDATGAPYSGLVTFTPSSHVAWTATGQVILDGPVTATLDSTGTASVVLPATDATGLSVTGFTYRVSYDLMGSDRARTGYRYPYSIQLPSAASTVTLEALSPLQGTGGVTVSVPTVQTVAGLSGAITLAALQAILGVGGVGVGPIDGGAPSSVYGPAVVTTVDGGDPSAVYGGIPGFDGGTPASSYVGTTTLNGGTP